MSIKLAIARRQLGTALALFLDDDDPVSVHCLACGGGEIAYQLASRNDRRSWIDLVLTSNPNSNLRGLLGQRNEYWNAMKHAAQRDGSLRDDDELMQQFADELNDEILFVGWYDFACAGGVLPIEAHVYQRWFLARYPSVLDDNELRDELARPFDDISKLSREQAKRQLHRSIEALRNNRKALRDVRLDRRKLILDRRLHPLTDEPVSATSDGLTLGTKKAGDARQE